MIAHILRKDKLGLEYSRFKRTVQARHIVLHACNPSTWEEAGGSFMSLRPSWATHLFFFFLSLPFLFSPNPAPGMGGACL